MGKLKNIIWRQKKRQKMAKVCGWCSKRIQWRDEIWWTMTHNHKSLHAFPNLWPTLTPLTPRCPSSPALIAETSVRSAVTPRAVTPTSRPVWAPRAATPPASPRTSSVPSCPTWSTTRPTAPSSTPTRLSPPPPLRRPCPRGTWVSSEVGEWKANVDSRILFYEYVEVYMDEKDVNHNPAEPDSLSDLNLTSFPASGKSNL